MPIKPGLKTHARGQGDHVDAWLISYADLITLLFMLFVIAVSVSASKRDLPKETQPPHYATMAVGLPQDELYRDLSGIVESSGADRAIAVQKSTHGVWADISSLQFFLPGTADIAENQKPLLESLLKAIALRLNQGALARDSVEVEAYTDDEPLSHSPFSSNWELAAMRAARMVSWLEEAGIDPARLRATSHAANHPLVPNADAAGNPIPENRHRNQRVVIKVETPE